MTLPSILRYSAGTSRTARASRARLRLLCEKWKKEASFTRPGVGLQGRSGLASKACLAKGNPFRGQGVRAAVLRQSTLGGVISYPSVAEAIHTSKEPSCNVAQEPSSVFLAALQIGANRNALPPIMANPSNHVESHSATLLAES